MAAYLNCREREVTDGLVDLLIGRGAVAESRPCAWPEPGLGSGS